MIPLKERFHNPTDIRWSCWQHVGEMLPAPNLKILIIAARSSQARAEQLCNQWLPGYDVEILPNVPADPTTVSVEAVIQTVKTQHPDWIIAMGGGSVLDTAKAAASLAVNPGDVVKYLRGQLQIKLPGIPLIAVPTTAGSGSEVTPYASITDSHKMSKISLSHDYLYPKYALLDPSLTLSLTRRQTAISGMDALCHAIEGYWSNRSTPATDSHALAAAKLLLSALPNAYRNPDDINPYRLAMEGSMLAGLTISHARTTAVHAVSYPMTVYFHIPHGLACSMLLPSFIRYNSGAMKQEKEMNLLTCLGFNSMHQFAEAVEYLQEELDLPVRLGDLGLSRTHIATIVDNGFRPDRMNNNPRKITSDELAALIESIA